jgi:hypothetical protein
MAKSDTIETACRAVICFIVTINTRVWSIGLFNWSIPYLIDHSHVLRLLLSNWLISMGFTIRFKGASSSLTTCAPHLTSPQIYYYFTLFTSFLLHSSTRFDQQELLIHLSLILVFVTQEPRKSGAQRHVTPHLTYPYISINGFVLRIPLIKPY